MQYEFLEFIDSKTLREQLKGTDLPPAVECIIIAQCRGRSLEDKLTAIEDRTSRYTAEEFKKGPYNFGGGDLREAAVRYIADKRALLAEAREHKENEVYVFEEAEMISSTTICRTLDDAIEAAEVLCFEDESCRIVKQKTFDMDDCGLRIVLDPRKEVTDVYRRDNLDTDHDLAWAYAEIPHTFSAGDIVRCGEKYAVVADVRHFDTLPPYMAYSDFSDMCLYCLRAYEDKVHSCKVAFCHDHFQVLRTEACSEDELPP
ncbi:MAG: hypothetical protein IJ071_02285 [Ruminococcus sp.]|nr:hypothetical protein [Ruminococcus sp.]